MSDKRIEEILQSRGHTDYRWLNPQKDIALAHWVRFKCIFGCNSYGKNGSCPPAAPPVEECHKMIREYKSGLILHFTVRPDTRENVPTTSDLVALEREIFLAGYYKAFVLPHSHCRICENCAAEGTRMKCIDRANSRPGADAMGIDIYETARGAGYSIEVVTDKDAVSDRFSFILIE